MLQTCNEMLRRGGWRQPDWFVAAESSLKPMIHKCNGLFSHWLLSESKIDR